MNKQIGYKELMKYIFENTDIEELISKKYFDSPSNITHIGYKKIEEYLKNNKIINNFNLILGILSSLAYGDSREIKDTAIKALIINNKELILSNIDSLEKIVSGTLKLEELNNINQIINMKMSFKLLNYLNYSWIEYQLHKKYFYGINYLLVYFSKYLYDDFETWFLSTKSNNLKAIFASQILSSSNFYQNEEVYLKSKIDFLRAISKIDFFTYKKNFFDNQKQLNDLPIEPESIYFIMLYIKNNYYKIDNENIDTFEQDIKKFKNYFQFMSKSNLFEFMENVNFQALYLIIQKIYDSRLKNNLWYEMLKEIKNQFNSFFDKSYISEDEINKVNLYGKIALDLQDSKEIENIIIEFDKLYNEINEPYYFYRFNEKWELSLKKMIYCLNIIYNFYYDNKKEHSKINNCKEKIYTSFKEYSFYNIDELKELLEQIEL